MVSQQGEKVKYDPEDPKHRLDLAIHLMSVLHDAGFKRDKQFETNYQNIDHREHVYSREIRDGLHVVVYTSCSNHKRFYVSARAKGNDAIRVATLYQIKNTNNSGHARTHRGLGKQKRVHRSGMIEDIGNRMLQRMREAWKIGNSQSSCHCGAPKFKSKKGNLVCADVCWTRTSPPVQSGVL